MRNPARATLSALVLALGLGAFTGCGDDPARPTASASIAGVVVDASDRPVPGVGVVLVYDLVGVAKASPRAATTGTITQRFLAPGERHIRMVIEDYAGQLVRTLVDEVLEAGLHSVTWRATDDADRPVPPGVYYAQLEIEGEDTYRKKIFLQFLDQRQLFEHAHARTDENGRFSIPLSLVPVGEELQPTDESGTPLDPVEVSDVVEVRALHDVSGLIASASRSVTITEGSRGLFVTLTLP